MKALVIIDVQNDFMPGAPLEVPFGDTIIPVINQLQNHFDLVVTTQDWHPQNHISFASNHPNKKPFAKISLRGIDQILWPDHCVQDTQGAMFHPALETSKIAAIFRKGMNAEVDSYSGFYDNGHQVSTGLAGYLREKGVNEVYYCGLAADICVYYTIKDSVMEGFHSTLVEDASQPLSIKVFASLKNELSELGVRIFNSKEVMLNI
jgi:nicotinamidase/pyrazinamidase